MVSEASSAASSGSNVFGSARKQNRSSAAGCASAQLIAAKVIKTILVPHVLV
jgi:hypothetical protein